MDRFSPAMRLLGIGWYVALCIALGMGGGVWLDRSLSTAPVFTLVGLFLGLGAAFVGGYRMLMEVLADARGRGEGGR
jgi:F0F1-type ATP synthase assembly protein I